MSFNWPSIFKKDIPKSEPTTIVAEAEEIWEPIPGHEKYYVKNKKGIIKSLGKEFEQHRENGLNEETSAWLTMMWLKGYLSGNKQLTTNIDNIIDVMKKTWKIRSIDSPDGKISVGRRKNG